AGRSPRGDDVSFPLSDLSSFHQDRPRVVAAAARAEGFRQAHPSVPPQVEEVGLVRKSDRLSRERLGALGDSATAEYLRLHVAQQGMRVAVLCAGAFLARPRELLGLLASTAQVHGL